MNNTAVENSKYLKLFCTPPAIPVSDTEMKALAKAETFAVRGGDLDLPCYAWGEGRTVLVCHGWGSRAGHLLLLAMALVRSGFRVVAFDAPAHYSRPAAHRQERSSMFEFGRAVSLVAKNLKDLHGVIGHSLGAMAALFSMAAFPHFEQDALRCGRLVLISAPASLRCVIGNFCRANSLDESERRELEESLQTAFSMAIEDYDCARALAGVPAEVLIVQDADDEQFAPGETLARAVDGAAAGIFMTANQGHDRILANRRVFAEIAAFLKA